MSAPRRYHLSTFGLSPDFQRVHPAFGKINRGDLPSHTMQAVMEKYRELHGKAPPGESHLEIQTDHGRFTVRVAGPGLSLGAEGAAVPRIECTSAEIMARLEKPAAIALAPPLPPPPPPPAPEPIGRFGVALVLLAAGLALLAHALNSVLPRDDAEPPPDITFVTASAEVKAQQAAVAGIFVTGQQPGDRKLTLTADGIVVFAENGPRQAIGSATDTYRVGRRTGQPCLVTTRRGVIEITSPDTLLYYGDTYRRVQ